MIKDSFPFAVGRSLPRIDIIEKAMGEARYNNDEINLDVLFLAIVGSPRPHLRLKDVDISQALHSPGVFRILTAHDISGKNRLPWGNQPFLVEGEAHFAGEPIVLVLAESRIEAQEAAKRIKLEFEERPAVTKLEVAIDPESPVTRTTENGHNIWAKYEREKGDVDSAFAESEQVIQQTYTTSSQAAASIEPSGILARPASDGGIHIEGSIQAPFAVQAAVSNILGLPYHRVYVTQRTLGGDTGSKGEATSLFAGYAALAAWLTGRPTRLILSSEEELRLSGRRPPSRITYKYGASREGILQVCEVKLQMQCGAYPGLVEMALSRALAHATGPYHIPAVRVSVEAIATHTTPFGLLMGYGQFPITFAQESLLDELAQRLNLSPVEIRKKNLLTKETPLPWSEEKDPSNHIEEALDAVLELSKWTKAEAEPTTQSKNKNKRRGKGIALGFTGISTGFESSYPPQAQVSVRLQRDGSVQVSAPIAKTGKGTRTLLAQIVAESLSVPYHAIHLLESGTLHSSCGPFHTIPAPLLLTGMALLNATQPLQETLLEVAGTHLGCKAEQLSTSPGNIHAPDGHSLTFAELVQLCIQTGHSTTRTGYASLPNPEPETPYYPAYSYMAQVAEVEIDMETFEVTVLAIHTACDQGVTINPVQAETEVEGQIFFGMGFALLEELAQKEGMLLNGSMLAYPIPEFQDMPQMRSIFLPTYYPNGPYHTKGFGSLAAINTPPAILNAIADALGHRIYDLPVTPEFLFSTTKTQS